MNCAASHAPLPVGVLDWILDSDRRDPELLLDAIYATVLAQDTKAQAELSRQVRKALDGMSERRRKGLLASFGDEAHCDTWKQPRRAAHKAMVLMLGYTIPPSERPRSCRNPEAEQSQAL